MRALCDGLWNEDITNEEIAYLAGIIDGEGTISIACDTKPNGSHAFILRLTISNSSVDLINWCLTRFRFRVQAYDRGNPKWSVQHILTMQSHDAKELIKLVQPYLVVKKAQAKAALAFPLNRSKKYSIRERVVRESGYANLKLLNKRGK